MGRQPFERNSGVGLQSLNSSQQNMEAMEQMDIDYDVNDD